jgi:hypothetical protein
LGQLIPDVIKKLSTALASGNKKAALMRCFAI